MSIRPMIQTFFSDRMVEMSEFYQIIFGEAPERADEESTLFTDKLLIISAKSAKGVSHPLSDQLIGHRQFLLLIEFRNIFDKEEELRENGVDLNLYQSHGKQGIISLILNDPDGNAIEIYENVGSYSIRLMGMGLSNEEVKERTGLDDNAIQKLLKEWKI